MSVAPSNRALQLWLEGQKDPETFRKQYLPVLIREKPQGGNGEPVGKDEGTEQGIRLVEKWLKSRKSRPGDQGNGP